LFLIIAKPPIIGQRLLRNRFDSPLDCGSRFLDGRPLLGPSKTWRGYLFSILITSACAWVEGLDMATGLVFSLAALLGDSVTSFIKRRLGLVSGGHAAGLDQVLESLPLLVVQHRFDLSCRVSSASIAFVILDLIFGAITLAHIIRKPFTTTAERSCNDLPACFRTDALTLYETLHRHCRDEPS
jgi:CDP-2,3-bis-(O-geranylgeranyl)-sn-glycerol synthase